MIGKFYWMSSILRGSPKGALSFETDPKEPPYLMAVVAPIFALKDLLSFLKMR